MELKESKIIGSIMSFDQKIVIPANISINLIEFYQEDRDDIKLEISSSFKKLLSEVTENGEHATVDISGEIIFQYVNNEKAGDYNIVRDMKEPFLRAHNDENRAEMRKRLAVAAYHMQQQPKGEEGILKNRGQLIAVGYSVISGGSNCYAAVARLSEFWYCFTCINLGQNDCSAGQAFWSRNSHN